MSTVTTHTGMVIHAGEIQSVGSGSFQKCEIVIKGGSEDYPQEIPFVFAGKKASDPADAGVEVGDTVTVNYELRGRAWCDRWFGEISGWKIVVNQKAQPVTSVADEDVPLDDEDPLDSEISF